MLDLPEEQRVRLIDPSIAMVNIIFLLLLFFIAAGTVKQPEPVDLDPPESVLLRESGSTDRALYVRSTGEMIYLGKKTVLADFIAQFHRETPDKRTARGKTEFIRIVSDRKLEARKLLEILNTIEASGLKNLVVVTRKATQ